MSTDIANIIHTAISKIANKIDPKEEPQKVEGAANLLWHMFDYPLLLHGVCEHKGSELEEILLKIIRESRTGTVPNCCKLLGVIYAERVSIEKRKSKQQ